MIKKHKDTGKLLQVKILWFRLWQFIKTYIKVKTLVKTFVVKKLIGGNINITYILY